MVSRNDEAAFLACNDYSWPFCVRSDRGWYFEKGRPELHRLERLGLVAFRARYPNFDYAALTDSMRTIIDKIDTLADDALAAARREDLDAVRSCYRKLGEIIGTISYDAAGVWEAMKTRSTKVFQEMKRQDEMEKLKGQS